MERPYLLEYMCSFCFNNLAFMTVCHENTKLLVFGGGNGHRHEAQLRGNAL